MDFNQIAVDYDLEDGLVPDSAGTLPIQHVTEATDSPENGTSAAPIDIESFDSKSEDNALKPMIGWKTMVNDPGMCFELLQIVNESAAHKTDKKEDYDKVVEVCFSGQKNSDGSYDGNALLGGFVKWKCDYPNRKMKVLVNGIIDFCAEEDNSAYPKGLHAFAKSMKNERDTSLRLRKEEQASKKKHKMVLKAINEYSEDALGCRLKGRGVGDGYNLNVDAQDPDFDAYIDGMNHLGRPTTSRGKS